MKRRTIYILAGVAVIAAAMIWSSLSGPGISSLKGSFQERAFNRNEQNTGPVIRSYIVTVEGEFWEEMRRYGDLMPHTKYGTTRVYFFKGGSPYPTSINENTMEPEPEFMKNCIALYEKDGMSQVSLERYPSHNRNEE